MDCAIDNLIDEERCYRYLIGHFHNGQLTQPKLREFTLLRCASSAMVLRGFIKGDSTLSMSRELGLGYRNLLYLRHELMGNALDNRHRANKKGGLATGKTTGRRSTALSGDKVVK